MFSMKKRSIFIIILIVVLILLTGCQKSNQNNTNLSKEKTESSYLMDTLVKMKVYGVDAKVVIDKSFSRMRDIENEMSRNIDTSEVSKINQNAGTGWVKVNPDTFAVIKKAYHYAELTSGKFDPTIGPLVSLWGIGTSKAAVPSDVELRKAKELVNYKWLELDNKNKRVKLIKENMKLDLGAIAKGYAADEVRDITSNHNIKSAFVNLGGNVLVIGGKPDGSFWKIGIQDPREARGSVMASLEMKDKTIVTSGNYERYFKEDGQIYHHILNPETGRPTRNNLLSVSIITNNSFDADAISTSAFILGKRKGMEFIENMDDLEAIFIKDNLDVYLTSGLIGKVKILDSDFKLIEGD